MTEEEFKQVQIGENLIEGRSHIIKVHRVFSNSVEYFENGYWHEVDRECLSRFPFLY